MITVMDTPDQYQPLTPETLGGRLASIDAVVERIGSDPADWVVREVGDGNLNLVFIVEGPEGTVIVKQALPYVRLVGDSWPLPLYRAFFENHALVRQAERDPGSVPEVHYFDETQALIVMEFLAPHKILRRKLIDGEKVEGLGGFLGRFCARTAFRGSELSMKSPDKKKDVGLFAGNIEIPAITEALVFTDPYHDAEMNHHSDGLDPVVSSLRSDARLKAKVQRLMMKFASNTETMVHGDLHSGSIMSTGTQSRIIDPEFVQYGPMGFDIGMLLANFLMAYFSQPAHREAALLDDYQEWLLSVIAETVNTFEEEFDHLWKTERTGMLYPEALFEGQGHQSEEACADLLAEIWVDALGFCGIEMHRRTLSLAHNADFEDIEDKEVKAALEARNLQMGADLIRNAGTLGSVEELLRLARQVNKKDIL
ncbi:S-methyl-5-thioribose kinase [Roseibium album]|uniref:S-methyl-5-thioribose kinase n=1 Tax=Roseibium album TaxID=311410 RepID=A0A0M7AWC8_9HYPH|nr:S-methyl-5-thioribose kinase [Roseibium album]CTQ61332.1 Methylthioribose kinase [Roseibium album]CTQ68029.1 Methylthioribose kinase [Roseibium album]CTQ79199.1 Methylthioribose kinase [Roseibium album]